MGLLLFRPFYLKYMEFLPAIVSAASTALSALGLFKSGSSSGKDPQYVADVNRVRQEEYTVAQDALTKITVPAAQQQIITAYNQEQALWGDPNNPNRNVANPSSYKAKVAEIVAQYSTTSTIPAVSSTGTGTAATASTIDPAAAINNFVNSLNSAIPLLSNSGTQNTTNYVPLLIVVGGIIAIFLLKGK